MTSIIVFPFECFKTTFTKITSTEFWIVPYIAYTYNQIENNMYITIN